MDALKKIFPLSFNKADSTNNLVVGIIIYVVIGFIAGAALAALIIFLINLFDTRVKSSEELSNKYNLPILGEVPNLHEL